MTRHAGITPRWRRKGTGEPLAELRIRHLVSYDAVRSALANCADVQSLGGADTDWLAADRTTDELQDMVRMALRMHGLDAADAGHHQDTVLAWAERHAARIWNGPTQ